MTYEEAEAWYAASYGQPVSWSSDQDGKCRGTLRARGEAVDLVAADEASESKRAAIVLGVRALQGLLADRGTYEMNAAERQLAARIGAVYDGLRPGWRAPLAERGFSLCTVIGQPDGSVRVLCNTTAASTQGKADDSPGKLAEQLSAAVGSPYQPGPRLPLDR